MSLLVIDNSDHQLAGGWFRDCLRGWEDVVVRPRDDVQGWSGAWEAVFLTGSERSVFEDYPWAEAEMSLIQGCYERGVPLLGVCYGHQLIFRALYGKDSLARRAAPEVGWLPVRLEQDPLFADVPAVIYPYIFHHDQLVRVPPGWRCIAASEACAVHAVRAAAKPVYGLQFHPEITPAAGAEGIRRQGRLLNGYGLDPEEIIKADTPGGRRYYGEIIRRFASEFTAKVR